MDFISIGDYSALLGAFTTLFIFIYTLQSLPNFVNQKRINNLSDDAKSALERLTDLKNTLKTMCHTFNKKEKKELANILLEELPNCMEVLNIALKRLPQFYEPILQHMFMHLRKKVASHEMKATAILKEVDPSWEPGKELKFEKFEHLEKKLIKNYNIPENRYHTGVKNFLITLVLSVIVSLIFYFLLNIIKKYLIVHLL